MITFLIPATLASTEAAIPAGPAPTTNNLAFSIQSHSIYAKLLRGILFP
jgi:hypothetical protein